MNIDKKLFNQLYTYLLLAILLLAVALQSGTKLFTKNKFEKPQITLEKVKTLFPKAHQFSYIGKGELAVYDNRQHIIGFIYPSYNYKLTSGYGGYVPVLWAIDSAKIIQASYMLSNNETPEFLDHLQTVGFLDHINGVVLEEILNDQIDAVSGATETSEAILEDLKAIAMTVSVPKVAEKIIAWNKVFNSVLFILLLSYAMISIYIKSLKKYRKYYLFFVVLLMGVITKKMLSLEFLQGILINGLPWQTNWEVVVLLILAILIPWIKQKGFYCSYLCPMGAMQELIGQLSPLKKRSLKKIQWKGISLSKLYLTLIWGSLLAGINLELSSLEPFMIFSFKVVGYGIIILTIVTLLLSVFYNRPWCSVCPTGCLLKTLEPIKSTKNTSKI